MRKSSWAYRLLSFVAAGLFLVAALPLPSTRAASMKLAEGMTWSYGVKLNGQLFGLAKATVVGREKTGADIVWIIKDEQFYRFQGANYKELRSKTKIEIRDDFTLKRFQRTTMLNGDDSSSQLIDETENGYIFSSYNHDIGETYERSITTQSPLFLYCSSFPWNYPWLFEILVKNENLTPERPCHVLSFPYEIIKVEYLSNSLPDPDHDGVYCYLAGDDRIYVNKNQDVIRIDSKTHGTFEFISGEGLFEKAIPGYDLLQIMETGTTPLLKPDDLTSLTVYVNLDQGFENVDYLQTPSARQKFVGTVDERIEGEVTITRTREEISEPANPFPFPVTVEWGPGFEKYLKNHPLVEADAPEIIAKAKEITKAATNTWEAAQSIAGWVWENIKYDTSYKELSALETLNEGRGVCAQFALLTTALCRAVNIPARYIAGYIYARDASYSFGPHAWVEVYADKAGWRAMDPTAGQFTFVDLTHIGFSDEPHITHSVFNLRPGSIKIKILDFFPKEAGLIPPPSLDLSQLEIYGEELRYEVFIGKHKDGEYTARLQATEDGNFCLLESVELPSFDGFKAQSELHMDRQGYVLKYSESGIVLLYVQREREFFFNEVIEYKFRHGVRKEEKEILRIIPNEVLVDLYKFVQWGLFAIINEKVSRVISKK